MAKTKPTGVPVYLAAFIVIIAGVMYAKAVVTPLILALFISIVCAQPIYWLQKRRVPQALAVAIVLVGVLAVFFGFAELINSSLSSFSQQAPTYEKNLRAIQATLFQFFNDQGVDFSTDQLSSLVDVSKTLSLTASLLGQLGSIMGNALTIFFLVLFLLLELDSITIKAEAIVSGKANSLKYFDNIGSSIRHYLSIKTLVSLITGVCIWLSLLIIGVDYAIIWGLIAFLLNYIPNIGSVIAAVPAVLFSVIQLGLGAALGTALVFVVVNIVIGNVIEPRLMGRGLGLSTFVVFFALIFWGFVFGTVGMFLSVPLTIAIKIMLEQNPQTKGIAIALGTQSEAQLLLDQHQNPKPESIKEELTVKTE
ncbi:MAG: AI-2E family transporter [Bacteroidota bacterium]